jgi:hypothetical protein
MKPLAPPAGAAATDRAIAGRATAAGARVARLAAHQPGAVVAPCWELRRRLRQEAFPEPGRPPLLLPARRLSDRVLRRRGELEDPIGAGGGI